MKDPIPEQKYPLRRVFLLDRKMDAAIREYPNPSGDQLLEKLEGKCD